MIRHLDIVNTQRLEGDAFVSTFPSGAASAVSEFGHEHETPPRALTVTGWMRAKRAIRAWLVQRMRPKTRRAP